MKSFWVLVVPALCLVLFLSIDVFSQSDSLQNRYVKEFSRLIFIGPVIKQRSVSFQLMNLADRSRKIIFRPNNSYSAGLRLNLFGIGVEASMSIPIAEKNIMRYGDSQVADFYFNTFSKKWMADFTRQRYAGFYFDRSWQPLTYKDIHPQRPDIEVKNSALAFTYIFNNKKFSIRSPFQFTEHQIRSSGSFLFGYIFSRFQVEGGSDIIETSDQLLLGDGSDARKVDLITFGLMPGYSYNLVLKNYFLNMTVLVGPAHSWLNYNLDTGLKHYDIDVNFSASYRAAFGYSGEHFFWGISFNANSIQSRLLETQLASSVSTLRLVAGMRFREKGFLTKRVSDLWK